MDANTRYPVDLREGLQLDVRRNVVQLTTTLGCAFVGSVTGFLIAPVPERWGGSALLGILGALLGISITGLWYMFRPPRPVALTIVELRQLVNGRGQRMRFVKRTLLIAGLFLMATCLVSSPRTSTLGGICLTALAALLLGGRVCLGLMQAAIESIRCPICGHHFASCQHRQSGETDEALAIVHDAPA